MSRLNGAIVGCGNIASNFDDRIIKKITRWTFHARMMSDSPKIKLIAVVTKILKKLKF